MKSSSRHKVTALLFGLFLLLPAGFARTETIHGCVSSAPHSLLLLNEGDRQPYDLLGDTTTVKPGDRVKVSGKKKKDTSGKQYFFIKNVAKNYGACKVSLATP